MEKPKIGINGSCDMGFVLLNVAWERNDVDIVAINDSYLSNVEWVTKYNKFFRLKQPHLLELTDSKEALRLDGKEVKIKFYKISKPRSAPWAEAGAKYVVECEGLLADENAVKAHLNEGKAKKVVIAVPGRNEHMFVMGVNEEKYNPGINIVSLANCTTSCLARLLKVIHGEFPPSEFPIVEGSITVTKNALKTSKGQESVILNVHLNSAMAAEPINEVLRELDADLKIEASSTQDDFYAIKLKGKLKRGATYEQIKGAVEKASEGKGKGIFKESWGILNATIEWAKDGETVELVAQYNNTLRVHCSHVIDLIVHMASRDGAPSDVPSPSGPPRNVTSPDVPFDKNKEHGTE